MHFLSRALLFAVIAYTFSASAQTLGTLEFPNGKSPRIKAENGLIISMGIGDWRNETQSGAESVDIFDGHLRRIVSLNLLTALPGAKGVQVYDASARTGVVAVAAVFILDGNPPANLAEAVLLYDFSGRLVASFPINPDWGVLGIEADEKGHLWTFTDNFEPSDPLNAPLIVEYSAAGEIIGKFVPRNMLWPHGLTPQGSWENHEEAMGYNPGVVWFWLRSTMLVTVSADDGKVNVSKTGLPTRKGSQEDLLGLSRQSSGDIVGLFREDGDRERSELAYYVWSTSTGKWSRFTPGECEGWPAGSSGDVITYAGYHSGMVQL
jgi:hypothetical protein